MLRADLITVFHNDVNHEQHEQLFKAIKTYEPNGGYQLIGVDNRTDNRGFAAGCNLGALHPDATSPIIGFLNPDVQVSGRFIEKVVNTLVNETVITGCRFGKPQRELQAWGVSDWVCGAAMFVTRRFFERVGGFDEQFVWGWEETDLIRQAQAANLKCRAITLPINHESPSDNSPEDARYKNRHFNTGAQRFYQKWPAQGRRRR